MRGPDCGSDHYLIRARLRLKLHCAKRAAPKSPRLDWRQLANADRRQEFQLALSNRFAQLADSDGVDEEEQKIAEAIIDSARPLCPPIRCRTQLWISEECLDLVAKRKKAKLVDFERYRQLNRDIRRMMKRDREAYWDQVAHDLEEAASRHEYRTLYRTLRDLSGKSKSINDNIKKADGTFVRSMAERLQRWKEFFDGLYNHDPPQGPPVAPPVIDLPPVLMSDAEPTLEEVKLAVYALKNGKSPGLDQVAAEGIKAGGDTLLPRLHNLIKLIWRLNKVPTRWKKAIIIPIHKKGDSRECNNYRGISLLSVVGKVFMKILQSRLQMPREQTSREEQAGFRPGRGCCDQIFALRQLVERYIRYGQRTVIAFIDFKSAFDCIDWTVLWRTLEADHVPPKIISLLKSAYDGSTSLVHDQFVTDLMFADDSAIFAQDDAGATDILYDIARHARPYGLKISAEKTKVMTTDGSPAIVYLEDVHLEQVQKFKYLGSLIQEKKIAATADIHSRIGQATAAFASLRRCVWRKSNVILSTKIRLYRSMILPILLYGSETWVILKQDLNKLEVFQMRCLRQILQVSLRDRISNNEIRHRCHDQPSIDEQIQRRQLRWFGHVCRMSDHRLPHRPLWRQCPDHWRIRRDAPKKIWVKQIEHDLKSRRLNFEQAKTVATDRQAWKKITGCIVKTDLQQQPADLGDGD
ncbi:putative 149 kDa protein [Labeo rohita]|uniref:149 kDa protein n=1 Tax=Labeo rohita TaxID=84645 RepID=A0ABQ8LHQ0_LABRO|nr:putative 149 kDa protein [Labeo rohita]